MMKYFRLMPCLVISIFGVMRAQASENDIILGNLWLNGADQGREVLFFQVDDKNYAECNIFKRMRIKVDLLEKHKDRLEYCLLSDSNVQSEVDEETQTIKVVIPASYFNVMEYDFNQLLMPDRASLGGYLNYEFYYSDSSVDSGEGSILTELGIFKDYWLFSNGVLIQNGGSFDTENNKNVYRLDSVLSFDFPKNLTRLVLGDTTTVSNPFQSSFRFGGLSFGTSFTERPDFIYWNAPTLRGSAALPSKVDLLLNGVSLYQQDITPGDYVLQTGLNIKEGGNAQIVVEDVLGNRTVQNIPLMINNSLLLPGLNEYNVSIGKLRYNYDSDSSDYRDFFSNVYYRRGITHSTTLGFNAVYSEDVKNLGFMWTQALSYIAVLDLYAVGSDTDFGDGYSFGASVSKYWNNTTIGFSGSYSTESYRTLGYEDTNTTNKYDIFCYLNISQIPKIGNFYLNYIERENYDSDFNSKSSMIRTGFSKNINRQFSVGASYYNDLDEDQGVELSFGYNFGKGNSISAAYSPNEYSRLMYDYNGQNFDYGLSGDERDSDIVYQAYGSYENRIAQMTGQYEYASEYKGYSFSYQGAVVFLDKKLALTRYVDNAFALVRVDDYPDIEVYRSLSPIGKTNKDSTVWVPDIIPYVPTDISFNLDQLDMDDKVEYETKQMVGLNKRGYIVNFPVYRTQKVVAHLVNSKGENFVQGSEVYLNQNNEVFYPIDAEGNVYLYGLVSGEYSIFVKTAGGESCKSKLNIPTEKKEINAENIIELICK